MVIQRRVLKKVKKFINNSLPNFVVTVNDWPATCLVGVFVTNGKHSKYYASWSNLKHRVSYIDAMKLRPKIKRNATCSRNKVLGTK